MKILAVRGANLASLEGEFALELAEGPLARAGVFAICGPTGAGKSTLLDAMCLALYDNAPRLDGGSRVRVGSEEDETARITTSDPRSILRKGAGQGHAEVDFLGVDGRRYRARWEVRRARGKANGKLQATSMSLVDLEDDKAIAGSRKTDVKDAIEARLGLSFDQFRRSVLLAQGDFAAFLDADAKERAGLLERMTGTEIYGVISMEAHARAVDARGSLRLLEDRAELVTLLSDEARAESEERTRTLQIRLLQDEQLARDAQRALAWHAQLEALRREEAEAQEGRERLERQLALWETRRHELALHAAALPVQPWLEALDRAEVVRAQRASERSRADAERSMSARRAREAEQALVTATARARAAEQALSDAGPALAQARALDDAIEAERARLASLEAKRRSADDTRAQAIARVEEGAASLARLEHDERRAAEWLDGHRALEPMAGRWERNEAQLARLLELAEEASALSRSRVDLAERHAAAEARLAERAPRAEEAARAEVSVRQAWEAALALATRAPSEALAEARTAWTERRSALQTMIGVAEVAQRAYDALQRQRGRAEQAETEAARATQQASSVERERELTRRALEEAQRARDQLRATLDLAAHREELREGEACPLCGSLDHPFAREHPAVEGLLQTQDARIRELSDAVSSLDGEWAGLLRSAEAHGEAARAAEREASSWRAELDAARARYAEAASALEGTSTSTHPGVDSAARPQPAEPSASRGRARASLGGEAAWPTELPATPAPAVDWGPLFTVAGEADGPMLDRAASDALVNARDAASAELLRLDAEERARRDREREAERRRSLYDQAREAAEREAREAREARETQGELARELARQTREHADRERRIEALGGELAAALEPWPSWRARLTEDPLGFASEVQRAVSEWRGHEDARALARASIASAAPAHAAAEREAAQAMRLAEEAHRDEEAAQKTLASKRASRASILVPSAGEGPTILGGETVEAREQALRSHQERARDAVQRAQDASSSAERAEAAADAKAARAQESLDEAERDLTEAAAKLAEALAAASLDEAGARARLSRDRAEIEGWKTELEHLDTARAKQATVLAERARKREAHEAHEPPALDAEQARQAVLEADKRSATTRDLLMAERTRLLRDDEQRELARAYQAELEAKREQLIVWETLSDLVGSANGAKLRVFAQSLTLEILLDHANHHLRELAPRYSLARVPGEDLALMVIDHEMGEEVRPVSSLSGGETFLVALGMALGLASLSSQRARVDSLFIDEGFGALDPSSLDVVLSTLDALQATGRQVGVISHVPTIAERFDTRVMVRAAGPARSRVELVEGFG